MRTPPRGWQRAGGILLVLVGVVVAVIAIGSSMLHRVMLQQHRDAHRFSDGEVAMQLAESGLNLSTEFLRSETLSVGSPLHQRLVASFAQDVGGEVPATVQPARDLVEVLGSDQASLELSVELRNFRPIDGGVAMRGVASDAREKIGELAFVAAARYRSARRTLVAAKTVRVVSTLAPVLGKFTLFVRERRGQDVNLLRYDRLRPQRGFRLEDGDQPARPLVLYHRTQRFPAILDGRLHSMGVEFEEYAPDQGGLVYLGGREPWRLNLVHGIGAGRYEELFQLRRTRYLSESPLATAEKEGSIFFGFYEGLLDSEKFAVLPRGGSDPVSDRTSALHLYGDTLNLTPTLVLGPAFRRFVTLGLLDGYWYPYRDRGAFSGAQGLEVFSGSYEDYARVMTQVQEDPYNRAFDFMATNREAHDADDKLATHGTPVWPPATLAGRALERVGPAREGDEYFLYPDPDGPVPGYCSLMRSVGADREDVFRGALEDLDGALLEEILRAKVTAEVADQAELFERYLDGRDLQVEGVVALAEGDLELSGINTGDGGLIMVPGTITIKGPVVQSKPLRPLTLVSLAGDVRVATDANVDVHLIALRGRFVSSGRLNLVGAVAAGELDLRRLVRGEEAKVITHDPGLDPTSPESYWANLRVVMDPKVRVYMDTPTQ